MLEPGELKPQRLPARPGTDLHDLELWHRDLLEVLGGTPGTRHPVLSIMPDGNPPSAEPP
jgi:hypothetical protein